MEIRSNRTIPDSFPASREQTRNEALEQSHEADLATSISGASRNRPRWRVSADPFQPKNDSTGIPPPRPGTRDPWLVSSLLDDDSKKPIARSVGQAAFRPPRSSRPPAFKIDSVTTRLSGFAKEQMRRNLSRRLSVPFDVQMKSACLAAIASSERCASHSGPVAALAVPRVLPALLFEAVSGALFGLIWNLVDPNLLNLKLKSSDRDWLYIAAGIASAIGLLFVFFLHMSTSRRVWPDYEVLLQQQIDAHYSHSVWEKTSKTQLNMLEAECSHLHDLRVRRRESAISGAQSKLQSRMADVQRVYSNVLRNAHASYPGRLNELESRRMRERQQIEQKYEADSQEKMFRRENDFRKLQSEFDVRTNESRRRYQQTWMELIRAATRMSHNSLQISDGFRSAASAVCPSWDQVVRNDTPFPTNSPAVLSLGNIEADLDMVEEGLSSDPRLKTNRQRFDVPILLPLHERPSLILKATGAGRDVAVKTLQSTMLRFLTSWPPGKVRFTILDPVGLGANVSAFMHLADYDELLVTNRMWTEPSHSEKKRPIDGAHGNRSANVSAERIPNNR